MRGNSNAPAKGKIEMRCKAMSAEQDGREATTLRRHPGILQPNYFKQLQKLRSGSAIVPFEVPANDLQQRLGRAIIIAFSHHAAGQVKSSEERSVGIEGVRKCRSWRATFTSQKKNIIQK